MADRGSWRAERFCVQPAIVKVWCHGPGTSSGKDPSVGIVILFIVLATTIWVPFDASHLGVQRGRLGGGSLDMGPASWFFCCLLLWIIAFPCYLIARSKYTTAARMGQLSPPAGAGYQVPQQYAATPPPPPVAMPVQFSPDGRWYWGGQSWLPVPPQSPPVSQPVLR